MRHRRLATGAAAAAALSVATAAQAQVKLTPVQVFFDADIIMQTIMVSLILATIAAVLVTVRKLASGPHLTGGSAFLKALRLGGPLIGLLGSVYNVLMINLAIANIGEPVPPYHVIAPGVAEATMIFCIGVIAGVVAVICNWAVEARIDRTVLKS